MRYLLSNNMSQQDRTELEALWAGARRVTNLGWFAGAFVSVAAMSKMQYFRSMAGGWKILSFIGIAGASKMMMCQYYSRSYGPLIGSYFRKYANVGAADAWEIRDRKREYYQIDDTQYMDYTEEDLKDVHRHANHGPQPDGEAKDASYLTELNAFLDGKENHLKDHPRFLNFNYEFIDKSYPSADQAKDLIEGKQ